MENIKDIIRVLFFENNARGLLMLGIDELAKKALESGETFEEYISQLNSITDLPPQTKISHEDIIFLARYLDEKNVDFSDVLHSFDEVSRLTRNVKTSFFFREIYSALVMAKTLVEQSTYNESRDDFSPILNGYKEAYKFGNIYAGFLLGYLHCYGIGVDVNRQKAIKYFEDTIDLIDWQAMSLESDKDVKGAIYYHLGCMYMDLDDIDNESNIWASSYFKEAIEYGNENASIMLEKLVVPTK